MLNNRDDWPLNLLLQIPSLKSDFKCSASIGHYLALVPPPAWSLSLYSFCMTYVLGFQKNEHGSQGWDLHVFRDALYLLHFSVRVKELQRYRVSKKTSRTLTLGKGRGHPSCCQGTIGAQWRSHSPPRWAVLRKACLEVVQILMSHLWTIKYFTFYMEILTALSATMAGVAANIVNNLLSLMSYQRSKGSSTR